MMKNYYSKLKKKLAYFLRPKAIVLSYHRISDVAIDPWELAVSPENFEQHLQVLEKYNLITTNALLNNLAGKSIRNGMVSITFDDGYRDNYLIAKPLLKKYQLPATIFIPSHYVDQKRQFWWDELQNIILGAHDLPNNLSILINKEMVEFDLGSYSEIEWEKHCSWIWTEPPPTKRAQVFFDLWKRLRPLSSADIEVLLDVLRQWASKNLSVDELEMPVNQDQLKDLLNDPLIEIGIHTMTHPALAFHPKGTQYDEIAGCKSYLEALGADKSFCIAYPYGIYNDETIEVCKVLGVKGGFTTKNQSVLSTENNFKLGRYQVKNWTGGEFEKKLNFWIKGYSS